MCGISGKLSWDSPPDADLIRRMNDRLRHRGPDAEGVHVSGPVVLGHRRLSIIDTSEQGNQPLSDTTRRFWIVFNGEIYNYRELRSELEREGVSFRTLTDTEVILEAYKKWGTDCLQRLNGMFAFALWSEPEQRLFLARDRLGKKPLFVYRHPGGGLTFASELKALMLDPAIPRKLNPRALGHYLRLNYILTSESIFAGVEKLAAAHFMVADQNRSIRTERYWNLVEFFHRKQRYRSEAEAEEALNALLEDSVKLRMISDVPLGAFLSSGIDSATITAAMGRVSEATDVQTFSIGFREKGFSETAGARETASYLGTLHRDQIVDSEMTSVLRQLVYACDEPFSDSSMIPMYFLARFARQHVTVSLSGDGGDELFAGYLTYAADRLRAWTAWLPPSLTAALESLVSRTLPADYGKVSRNYQLRQFLAGHRLDALSAHLRWRQILARQQIQSLIVPELLPSVLEADPEDDFRSFFREAEGCHYLDRLMYVDIKTWLVDDILVKVDRTTMAHSLEARAPFLDYRMVEFAASLPVALKLKRLSMKYILRRSQRKYLPSKVLARKKAGFNAPLAQWLARADTRLFNELRPPSFLRPNAMEAMLEAHRQKSQDNSLPLFAQLNLWHWCELFGCATP